MRLSMSDPLRGSFFILRAFILVFLLREVRDTAKLSSFLLKETRHATSLHFYADDRRRGVVFGAVLLLLIFSTTAIGFQYY